VFGGENGLFRGLLFSSRNFGMKKTIYENNQFLTDEIIHWILYEVIVSTKITVEPIFLKFGTTPSSPLKRSEGG